MIDSRTTHIGCNQFVGSCSCGPVVCVRARAYVCAYVCARVLLCACVRSCACARASRGRRSAGTGTPLPGPSSRRSTAASSAARIARRDRSGLKAHTEPATCVDMSTLTSLLRRIRGAAGIVDGPCVAAASVAAGSGLGQALSRCAAWPARCRPSATGRGARRGPPLSLRVRRPPFEPRRRRRPLPVTPCVRPSVAAASGPRVSRRFRSRSRIFVELGYQFALTS
jgi:hypothetical protein